MLVDWQVRISHEKVVTSFPNIEPYWLWLRMERKPDDCHHFLRRCKGLRLKLSGRAANLESRTNLVESSLVLEVV
jgi:hypothetical protein